MWNDFCTKKDKKTGEVWVGSVIKRKMRKINIENLFIIFLQLHTMMKKRIFNWFGCLFIFLYQNNGKENYKKSEKFCSQTIWLTLEKNSPISIYFIFIVLDIFPISFVTFSIYRQRAVPLFLITHTHTRGRTLTWKKEKNGSSGRKWDDPGKVVNQHISNKRVSIRHFFFQQVNYTQNKLTGHGFWKGKKLA